MSKKHLFAVMFVGLFLMLLSGCNSESSKGGAQSVGMFDTGEAQKTVETYFKKYFSMDYKGAYELLAKKEKSTMTLDEFNPETGEPTLADGLIRDIRQIEKEKNTFTATKSDKKDGAIVVTGELSYVDRSAILAVLPVNGLYTDWVGARSALKKMKDENKIPMAKEETSARVIKEDGSLRLVFGWYDTEQKQKKEVDSYKSSLKMHDVKVKSYDDYASVKGYIKNTGSRTIKTIMLTAYFLDKDGNRIGEDTGPAISEGSDPNAPTKPNYDAMFIFEVPDGIRKSWGKKAEVVVTGIEFANENSGK